MLQITPQHRLLLAVDPVDFRKGICGLKAICQQKLLCDPFSIEILSGVYVGRELIRGNEKIKGLISEKTKLVEVDGKTIAEWMTMAKKMRQKHC